MKCVCGEPKKLIRNPLISAFFKGAHSRGTLNFDIRNLVAAPAASSDAQHPPLRCTRSIAGCTASTKVASVWVAVYFVAELAPVFRVIH